MHALDGNCNAVTFYGCDHLSPDMTGQNTPILVVHITRRDVPAVAVNQRPSTAQPRVDTHKKISHKNIFSQHLQYM
jgi:hypothetical protein